jgi:iron complex outermembrane receptor protein
MRKTTSVISLFFAASLVAVPGQAQSDSNSDSKPSYALEEVIVTANKREENLQDVPMSVSAFSEQFFKDTGVTELSDLAKYTPSLTITPGADSRSTSVRIRGIGSVGSNSGIDPSVGIFIDGVYQGRAGMSVSDLFDIERVQVLRGPQGTLYGKNTAAGAITINTRDPSLDLEANIETVIANNERYELRGMVNVPFGDTGHAMRVTAFGVDSDHLYDNKVTGNGINNAHKYGTKTKFLFDFSDAGEYVLTLDYTKEDTDCCAFSVIEYEGLSTLNSPLTANPSTAEQTKIGVVDDPRSFYNPGDDRMQFIDLQTTAANNGQPFAVPNSDPFGDDYYQDVDPYNKVEVGGVSLEANWEITGDHTLTFIPAWRHYKQESGFDGDFGPAPAVFGTSDVDLDQYSGEFRIASAAGETWEYQAGIYGYYSDMDSEGTFAMSPLLITSIPPFEPGAAGLDLFYPNGSLNIDTNNYKTTSFAAFGQTTWNISEKWSTTLGLRYTTEEKTRKGSQVTEGYDFFGETDPCAAFVEAPPVAGSCLDYNTTKSDSDISPSLTVRFYPVEDLMTYALVSRGFKSGGFDQRRLVPGDEGEFDAEESTNYELGWKGTWLDRRLIVNGTFYFVDYDDFQSQTFDGSALKVTNAGTMQSYGTELEIVFAAGENTTMGSAIGYNKAEYDEFDLGQCTVQGTFDWYYGDLGAQDGSPGAPSKVTPLDPNSPLKWPVPNNAAENTSCSQDLAGEPVENTPEWTASSWIQYNKPIGELVTVSRIEHQYTDSYHLDQDQDSNLKNDSLNLFNLRFTLTNIDNSWEAAIWGNNVTDEESYALGIDIPTVGGFAGIVAPRRTYGLTLRYNWY